MNDRTKKHTSEARVIYRYQWYAGTQQWDRRSSSKSNDASEFVGSECLNFMYALGSKVKPINEPPKTNSNSISWVTGRLFNSKSKKLNDI